MSESNIQASPGSIFICYRREDSAAETGRIYDRLVDHFGPERVFMDVEAIRLGYDFRSEIDQTIKVCSIVIVVIGDEWLVPVDGKRRIDDENDYVRIEIEAALRRKIPIIPVLTRGVSHPTKAMLPASLEDLAYRHGTSIRHEHFRGDVDSLISQMDKLLGRQQSTPSKPVEPKEPATPVKSTQATQSRPANPPVAPAVWRRKRLIIVTAVGATVIILLLAITWLLTRPPPSVGPSEPSNPAEPKLTDQGHADVPSTNIDKPTLLTSKEIRGNGVGENISYYYTFSAGPGEVKVTVDSKSKPGLLPIRPGEFSDAVAVEVSDLDAKRLFYVEMNYNAIGKRKVERFQLGRRQQVIMRILLGEFTLNYMVRVEGSIDFSPAPKAQRPQ